MISKKDTMVGFGILPTDVYFQYTTVSQQPIVLHVNQLIPTLDWLDDVAIHAHRSCMRSTHCPVRWITIPP